MSTKTLQTKDLQAFLEAAAAQHRLVAPVRDGDRVDFAVVTDASTVVPTTDYVNPRRSLKSMFFPRTEPILDFDRTDEGLQVKTPEIEAPSTLLFGCRPCDASSLAIMDKLYDWDYHDTFWFQRRAATTVVAVSCVRADESCFCTALGGSPCGTEGADLLLTPTGDAYLVEILTEKGQAAIDLAPSLFADGQGDKEAACKDALDALPPALDLDAISEWLKGNFESDLWAHFSWRCLGCGCCTFLCPTCHCFDIVDEGSYRHGQRRKNWDGCQFGLFTLHASGHNPRSDQAARWRQRLEHKFNYYVQKFDRRSCVGCGRCIRHCPVNMNIHAQLTAIGQKAAENPA